MFPSSNPLPGRHSFGMHASFVVLLFVLHASAKQWNTEGFSTFGDINVPAITYHSKNGQCRGCNTLNQCLDINQIKCNYYLETTKILEKPYQPPSSANENGKLKAEVDSMVFSIMERAKTEGLIEECIPYVSKYTDCTKENICLGCKTCECTAKGLWNCTITQTCRPDLLPSAIDQRILYGVIDTLNHVQQKPVRTPQIKIKLKLNSADVRRKRSAFHSIRSIEDNELEKEMNEKERETEKLSEWAHKWTESIQDKSLEFTNSYDENKIIKPHAHTETDQGIVQFVIDSIISPTLPHIIEQNKIDIDNNRVKREANLSKITTKDSTAENSNNVFKNKITFEELSDWLSNVHPLIYIGKANEDIIERNRSNVHQNLKTIDYLTESHTSKEPVTVANPDYLAFEEVFHGIHVDNKTYTRRKPPLDHSPAPDIDFNMYDDKYYTEDEKRPDNVINVLTSTLRIDDVPTETNTESDLRSATKFVVDLLDTANIADSENKKFNTGVNNNKIDNPASDSDQLEAINAVNIMKRDISVKKQNITNSTNETHVLTTTNLKNSSETNLTSIFLEDDLKHDVLDPIENMVGQKQKEINELIRIKNRLVRFLKDHIHTNGTLNDKSYKSFRESPHYFYDTLGFRRSNVSILDKYMLKLKHDVFEVIRDIVGIKRLYNASTKFPSELTFLIRSLKHYVHKTSIHPQKENTINYRRKNSIPNKVLSGSTVKNAIIQIFQLLLKARSQTDALDPLSRHSKSIIKRIIKRYYVDDFVDIGLRVYDPQYNLTKDLNSVGSKWQKITLEIKDSGARDKLDNMKKLHLVLSSDIAKMRDALALIEYARGRRMIPSEEEQGEAIVESINKNLNSIKYKLNEYVLKKLTLIPKDYVSSKTIMRKRNKKKSFIAQIKKLLRDSKRDILKLLRRKMTKSDIIKSIARQNVEEMARAKLQDTMKKWQTNLNIIQRGKRSANTFDNVRRRIKNIIPKYLRRKVPGMTKNNKGKKGKGKKKNSTSGHKKIILSKTTARKPTTVAVKSKTTTRHTTARHTTARHTTARHTTAIHTTARHTTARHTTARHTIEASKANTINNSKATTRMGNA